MKTSSNTIPALIEKEAIIHFQFPKRDVLDEAYERSFREFDLHHATRLGNLEKHKVEILFKDEVGLKQVETTIWATTKNNIVLKGGITIPINRIYKVKY